MRFICLRVSTSFTVSIVLLLFIILYIDMMHTASLFVVRNH